MTRYQKRFIFFATVILASVFVVSQIFFSTIFVTKNFPGRIFSICLVWIATCASCFSVMKTVKDKPKAFIMVFILHTLVKLFLYTACIVAYLFHFRQHGVPFTLHFLFVYSIFAIFEVSSIVKFVKDSAGIKSLKLSNYQSDTKNSVSKNMGQNPFCGLYAVPSLISRSRARKRQRRKVHAGNLHSRPYR